MFFNKRSPNVRKKIYYTLKITEQEYNNLRHYLKTNKIPYKKRFNYSFKVSRSAVIAIALGIVLIILGIIFVKIIQ